MGVILHLAYLRRVCGSIPHIRGGDPDDSDQPMEVLKYSPHTWG
nr:hypothetical protein [Ligilactobacillus saerimneri]